MKKKPFEIKLNIKPLSVNEAWQGKRFKTPKYKAYEKELLLRLPKLNIPQPPYKIYYEFGLSNSQADYDNCIKQLQDILQKKYNFNDCDICEALIRKIKVKKKEEYFKVTIEQYK